jgi:hypothetical protein
MPDVKALATVLALLAISAIAEAAPLPPPQSSAAIAKTVSLMRPGWVGIWGTARSLPPGAPPVELPYDELVKHTLSVLQPWAIARQEATEWNTDDTGQVCKPDGIFRQGHAFGSQFRWIEANGKVYEIHPLIEIYGLHQIYFNSPHPRNVPLTWNGDSRAHWEGDTLVVDKIGFNDKSWLNSDRHPHTSELHVIERYQLLDDGKYLALRVFVDDRLALKQPYTYTRYYQKMPDGEDSQENICNMNVPEENLWRVRRDELLAEHDTELKEFMLKYSDSELSKVAVPSAKSPESRPISAKDSDKLHALAGIYEAASLSTTLPGGLKGSGTLADLPLQAAAIETSKKINLKNDPAKNCQAIGPFRMMAREANRIEILPSQGRITMMFENIALGNKREIFLNRPHPPKEKLKLSWLGDSVGLWDGDTLVVDTIGFNDRTWLNDAGAPHSNDLRTVERYQLVDGGKYLELKVTAEDPKVLTKPYTYTRYYQRRDTELAEDFCQETE